MIKKDKNIYSMSLFYIFPIIIKSTFGNIYKYMHVPISTCIKSVKYFLFQNKNIAFMNLLYFILQQFVFFCFINYITS
jgi:hypothetical protein